MFREMREVPLEHDIQIAVNGLSWWRLRTKNGPFTTMLISCSTRHLPHSLRLSHFMNHLTLVPVEEHSVAHGAEVGALAGYPGLEAHLVLVQVDGDGGGHGRRGGRHLDCSAPITLAN